MRKIRCCAPAPDMPEDVARMVGTVHGACCKPVGHELPHGNVAGLMWNAEYIGWPTPARR